MFFVFRVVCLVECVGVDGLRGLVGVFVFGSYVVRGGYFCLGIFRDLFGVAREMCGFILGS